MVYCEKMEEDKDVTGKCCYRKLKFFNLIAKVSKTTKITLGKDIKILLLCELDKNV